MKVYHISDDIFKSIKEFVPRVPKSRLPEEDSIIGRICVGLSIEDCLCGLQYEMILARALFVENMDCYDYVHGFRSMKVYELECSSQDIIKPKEIVHLVPDALKSNECWLQNCIKPIKEYIINIEDFDYTADMIISNLKYSIGSEDDFYKKAIITVNNASSFDELFEYLNDNMCVDIQINRNCIELNLIQFPLPKDYMRKTIHGYVEGFDCNVSFV